MSEPEMLPFTGSVSYQIRLTHRAIHHHLAQQLQPHGITLGMWYFLRALWDQDGLTQRELSEIVGTREPTTLNALKSMEQTGLIRRSRNSEDKRKLNVFLTSRGAALKDELLPLGREVTRVATVGFSSRERENLLDLLKAVQENFHAFDRARGSIDPA